MQFCERMSETEPDWNPVVLVVEDETLRLVPSGLTRRAIFRLV